LLKVLSKIYVSSIAPSNKDSENNRNMPPPIQFDAKIICNNPMMMKGEINSKPSLALEL
jgi:hypothetical protein